MRMVIEMIKLVIYVVLLFLGFCLLTDSTCIHVFVQKQNLQMKIDVVLNYVFIFCISEEQIYSIHTC